MGKWTNMLFFPFQSPNMCNTVIPKKTQGSSISKRRKIDFGDAPSIAKSGNGGWEGDYVHYPWCVVFGMRCNFVSRELVSIFLLLGMSFHYVCWQQDSILYEKKYFNKIDYKYVTLNLYIMAYVLCYNEFMCIYVTYGRYLTWYVKYVSHFQEYHVCTFLMGNHRFITFINIINKDNIPRNSLV